jgi:transposase
MSGFTSEGPPRYGRAPAGSVVDAVEPRVRELLMAFPSMPAAVIAERVGWSQSIRTLSARVSQMRPAYLSADPASRRSYVAGRSPSATCGSRRSPVGAPDRMLRSFRRDCRVLA